MVEATNARGPCSIAEANDEGRTPNSVLPGALANAGRGPSLPPGVAPQLALSAIRCLRNWLRNPNSGPPNTRPSLLGSARARLDSMERPARGRRVDLAREGKGPVVDRPPRSIAG